QARLIRGRCPVAAERSASLPGGRQRAHSAGARRRRPVGTPVARRRAGMIRITEGIVVDLDGTVVRTLRVEGALRREWVGELRRAWREGPATSAVTRLELADVPFIDPDGRRLLADMHVSGVEIVARGMLCEGIRDEIVGSRPRER